MSDRNADTQGEHPQSDRRSDQHAMEEHQPDRKGGAEHTTVPTDFDVEAPTESGDGEPVHHNMGGDIGEGGD